MAGRILPPARRTRRAFAEATIIVPDGKYKNEYFNVDTQPFTRLLIAEMDSGRWSRFAVTGPTQTGKSFIGYVLPILYHLFELCENVILGLPDLNMASDKWRKDILPVIRASRYADQLPDSGRGSRSDEIKDSVTFKNGATLKVMSGGGGDAKRSGYTARVVAMTEVDKMDRAGEASRETSKIGQLEARTDAFADDAITYMECTVSYEEGRIWQEYIHGTASRIACPCPHCRVHVTPEREHLIGWVNAETEMDARENARWACPHCGAVITEDERIEMNRRGVLVHRGQEVTPEGEVVGPPPRTRTLGFRWNAFNNLFWTAATVASREWRAARNPDEEDAKKEMCQFVWVTPYKPPKIDLTQLDAAVIVKRITGEERGRVPADASYVTVGLDLGKRLCHWAAPAWREDGSPHVMDYGRFEVASDELGIERALLAALRDFRDQVTEKGWQGRDEIVKPGAVFIDCGWVGEESEDLDEIVYAFCRESNELCGEDRYMPAKGWAAGRYRHPTEKSERVREVGDNYYVARIPEKRARLVHVNSDYWKGKVHERCRTPLGKPGALTLFATSKRSDGTPNHNDHIAIAKHVVAEKQEEEFEPGKGVTRRYVVLSRANHWLDALMLASAAGHRAGYRLVPAEAEPAPAKFAPAVSRRREPGDEDKPAGAAGWFGSRRRRPE
jgi:phage terminase large subunit GpA-like protein